MGTAKNTGNIWKMMSTITLMAGLLLLLAGCGGGESQSPAPETVQTGFNFALPLDLNPAGVTGNTISPMGVSCTPGTLSGQLLIEPGIGEPYNFFVTLDAATTTVETDIIIDLVPRQYIFYLWLSIDLGAGCNQYVAIQPQLILAGDSNIVTVTLFPLLLDVVTNVEQVKNLFKLEYPYPADIGTYADPRFGITLFDRPEDVFKISNPNDPDGNVRVYLPATPPPPYDAFDSYTIIRRFYDGEVVTDVVKDEKINPDGTSDPIDPQGPPLTSVTYSFDAGTGEANFYFPIPEEVVDLVGGPSTAADPLGSRLDTEVAIVSGGSVLFDGPLTLNPFDPAIVPFLDGGSVTLPGFTPGALTWALRFVDPASGALIGFCASNMDVGGIAPDADGAIKKTSTCTLNLINLDIQTNFPVVAVNFSVNDGAPVTGAVINLVQVGDDQPLGITDSLGALQIFLQAGTYTFQAIMEGRDPPFSQEETVTLGTGNVNFTVPPLDVAPPDPGVIIPEPVTGLSASADDGLVSLSWVNPADPNVTGLRVVRSTDPGTVGPNDAGLTAWDLSAGTAFLDDDTVSNGTRYYYTVFTHNDDPVYSTGVQVSAEPVAPPPPPDTFDPLVLTATRTHRPRNFIDGALDVPLAEGETVTVTIPGLEALEVLAGNPNHFLLFVYLGDVKCMYVGGNRDRYMNGRLLEEAEEIFERAIRSPVCTSNHRGWFRSQHQDDGDDEDDDDRGDRLREGDRLTTSGPIRSRVITGHPHFDETTVRITIPVVDRTSP